MFPEQCRVVPPPLAPPKNPVTIALLLDALQDFSALEPSQPPRHIGRIRLSEIATDWIENQPINPRLLAVEVAGVLRTLGPGEQILGDHLATIALFDAAAGSGGISLDALADYFDHLSEGRNQDTIITTTGSVRTGAVLVGRTWLNRLADEATARAAIATGLIEVVEASPGGTMSRGTAATAILQPVPPAGSSPECLGIRQAQQRTEGEISASEQLTSVR